MRWLNGHFLETVAVRRFLTVFLVLIAAVSGFQGVAVGKKNVSQPVATVKSPILLTVEQEPLPDPDLPFRLCLPLRAKVVALQNAHWLMRGVTLPYRKVVHWQYRNCLVRTTPESQRYLESFPVPYVPVTKPVSP
jgi:hypothetical protein